MDARRETILESYDKGRQCTMLSAWIKGKVSKVLSEEAEGQWCGCKQVQRSV